VSAGLCRWRSRRPGQQAGCRPHLSGISAASWESFRRVADWPSHIGDRILLTPGPYRLVDHAGTLVGPGCGVPAGLAGVRPAGDHAARVCDRAVALVPVLVGDRGAVGSGDPGRHPSAPRPNYGFALARGHSRPIGIPSLDEAPVDAVTEGVGGLFCECLSLIAEDDAYEMVLPPRLRSRRPIADAEIHAALELTVGYRSRVRPVAGGHGPWYLGQIPAGLASIRYAASRSAGCFTRVKGATELRRLNPPRRSRSLA